MLFERPDPHKLPDHPMEWLHDASRRAELAEHWRREVPGERENARDYYRYVTDTSGAAERWRAEVETEIANASGAEARRRDWQETITQAEAALIGRVGPGEFPESAREIKTIHGFLDDLPMPVVMGIGRAKPQYDALVLESRDLARRNIEDPARLASLARDSIVNMLADALNPDLPPEERWDRSQDFFDRSPGLRNALENLKQSLGYWHSLLGSRPVPDHKDLTAAANQILEDSRHVMEARAAFLNEVSSSKDWAGARAALAVGASAFEVAAAAKLVAEQLWARTGTPSFSKMASRIGEMPIPERAQDIEPTRRLFEVRMDKLDQVWRERVDEVARALRRENPADDAPWVQVAQLNRMVQVGETLRLWCAESAQKSLDVGNLDKLVTLLAFDLRVLKDTAGGLRSLGEEYSGIGSFLDETIDGLTAVMERRISFHVKRAR